MLFATLWVVMTNFKFYSHRENDFPSPFPIPSLRNNRGNEDLF